VNYIDIAANVHKDFIGNLGPGDKFFYKGTYHIIVDFKPSAWFKNAIIPDMVAALDTDTYKIVCFDVNTEVEVINCYGGL
jgi:hypothetical protein